MDRRGREQAAEQVLAERFTVTALQATRAAIVQSNPANAHFRRADDRLHLVDALQAAVRIGDDTDTVAAIAGGLLGGYCGPSAVPDEWQELVHG